MIPIPYTFQQMLKRYIPILTDEKIDDNENLLALRVESRNELYMIPKKNLKGKDSEYYLDKIKSVTVKATEIIKPYEKSYNAAQRLWIARRDYAMEHCNFLQIPISITYIRRFLLKAIHYRIIEVQTLPILWIYKIKYHFQLLFNINKKESNNNQ